MAGCSNNLDTGVSEFQYLFVLGDLVNAGDSSAIAADDRTAGFLLQFSGPADMVPMMMCNENRCEV
jgi:hypothetical protein